MISSSGVARCIMKRRFFNLLHVFYSIPILLDTLLIRICEVSKPLKKLCKSNTTT